MSKWTIYDIATGLLRQQIMDVSGPLDDLQPGQSFVTGHFDVEDTYVVAGDPIPRPPFLILISNNNEPAVTGLFRLDAIPEHTIVTYDDQVVDVTDGYFELTSATDGTIPVTLTLFPYKTRTIDAIFTP